MTKPIIHVGQVGISIRAHCVDENGKDIDVSGASSMTMKLKSPLGVEKSFSATHVTDGEDGRIEYITTAAADIDEDGWWASQADVVTPSKRFSTEKLDFPVRAGIF